MTQVRPRGPHAQELIRSMRNRVLGWNRAIGEFIDNSAGNGAKTITVRFEPHKFSVVDDGVGCTERKFAALASIGWHEEDDLVENPVSRFGIGAKDAFIWAGGPTILVSRRSGVARYIEVDWDSFGAEFEYGEVIKGDAAEKYARAAKIAETGTAVISPHHTRQMNEAVFNSLRQSLNEQHWAAVESGIIIRVEYVKHGKKKRVVGGPLPGKPMPALMQDATLDVHHTLSDGRQIRIVGGVLDPSVRLSRPGFEHIFGHRVVVQAGGLGAGPHDFERVYFRVSLLGAKTDWRVTTNKCGLHDADEAAIGEAVYQCCSGLLERSQSEDMAHLLDEDLLAEVGELLSNANRKKAKRNSPTGDNAGRKPPTGRGTKHSNASKVGDEAGNCRGPAKMSGIRVRKTEFEEAKAHLIGEAVVRDRLVRLNTLHPFVHASLKSRDINSLFLLAMSLWSDVWINNDENGQRRIAGVERTTFVDKLSAMLKACQREGIDADK